MNILLINAYSASNRGDAGIVVSMIGLLRRVYPDCKISVMSSYWRQNTDFYKLYGVLSVPPVWELKNSESKLMRYFSGFKKVIQVLANKDSGLLENYNNADIICSVGGGYLYSSRKGPLGVGLLNALFHYWVGTRLKKNVIGFPQSVGPIKFYADHLIVRSVLKKINVLMSRDIETTKTLVSYGLKNYINVIDVAFDLRPSVVSNSLKGDPKIGLTVLDWRFANSLVGDEDMMAFKIIMSNILKRFLNDFPAGHIYIFPQVDVEGEDSDVRISMELESMVDSPQCTYYSLRETNRPEEIVSLYSQMDAFIGSRMHSTIFALLSGVPTIGLAYQPKTIGTFKALGLGDYAFDINSLNEDDVYKCLVNCINGRQNTVQDKIRSDIEIIESEMMKYRV